MLFFELIEKGGVVMLIIMLLSVYVLAVILYKIYQFTFLENFNDNLAEKILSSCEQKNYIDAFQLISNMKNPVARVVEQAIRYIGDNTISNSSKTKNIEALGSKQLKIFDSHLKGLELVAAIAPLLGLLGTVLGMVTAFSGIEQVGSNVDPSVLAGGIWEALLTTVAGLIVAIPALSAHHIIDGKVENIRRILNDTVSRIIPA